jgi:hypothetical protein
LAQKFLVGLAVITAVMAEEGDIIDQQNNGKEKNGRENNY